MGSFNLENLERQGCGFDNDSIVYQKNEISVDLHDFLKAIEIRDFVPSDDLIKHLNCVFDISSVLQLMEFVFSNGSLHHQKMKPCLERWLEDEKLLF